MKKTEKTEKAAPVREFKTESKLGRVIGAATVAAVKHPAGASTRIL